jgi:hypothetical protein
MTIPAFPDAEMALMYVLAQAFTDDGIRFVTVMPAGDLSQTTVRLSRISGADRGHFMDHPIIDVDVFAMDHGEASTVARDIQAAILSLRGAETLNGKAVISHPLTINAPRRVPEVNPKITRMNATYEISIQVQGE